MGTRGQLRVFAPDAAVAMRAIGAAVQEIDRLEKTYSRYRPGNFMHRLNAAACAGGEIVVDRECQALLDYADECHRHSDGLFDISSGVLRHCWNFQDGAAPALPDPQKVAEALTRVGWQHVQRRGDRVRFRRAGMELDFGGIVKEYAVDRAAAICREQRLRHGVVDLGGDIAVFGPRGDGRPWSVGVQHPRRPNADLARLEIGEGALATSGDYARCVQVGARRYSHILSPRTGWPVQGLASVTVLAERCVLAGSACTAAMLKEHDGATWLDEIGVPHLWVDLDGQAGGSLWPAAGAPAACAAGTAP